MVLCPQCNEPMQTRYNFHTRATFEYVCKRWNCENYYRRPSSEELEVWREMEEKEIREAKEEQEKARMDTKKVCPKCKTIMDPKIVRSLKLMDPMCLPCYQRDLWDALDSNCERDRERDRLEMSRLEYENVVLKEQNQQLESEIAALREKNREFVSENRILNRKVMHFQTRIEYFVDSLDMDLAKLFF